MEQLAEACGCHPSELLTASSKQIYELLLYEAEQLLLDNIDISDRSVHVARLSREIRQWEKFFGTGVFADEEDERSMKLSESIRKIMFEEDEEIDDEVDDEGGTPD